MEMPDRLKFYLCMLIMILSTGLKSQSADIGLISVDSIVAHSQIGDSSTAFIQKVLMEEQQIFRDSFERFQADYDRLLRESGALTKEPGNNSAKAQKSREKRTRQIQHVSQKLYCMEHLATSMELLYEEELQYFVSEELRKYTEEVKKIAEVSVIVTHKPLYMTSENEQEEIFFLHLNQLFINVVQNSIDFRHRWAGFKQQMIVKFAALKLNMYQHCFNN